jgi:hypothetical protein
MPEVMDIKIVVAISQGNEAPWTEIRKTQQETWIRKFENQALIIHYSSKNPPLILKILDSFLEKYRFHSKIGRVVSVISRVMSIFTSSKVPKYRYNEEKKELVVNSYSTYLLFGRRNLALYDWFLKNTNAKFLFQTNTSSYLDVAKLIFITSKLDPNNSIFSGVINNPQSNSFKIISGAGRLLSRELIIEILKYKNLLKFDNLEDICISELIAGLPATVIPLERYDLPSIVTLNETPDDVLRGFFHFRCKSENALRSDSKIMLALHQRL